MESPDLQFGPEPDPPAASPRVCVVVPAYQSAGFIAAALQSVFAQTYRNLEVVVINDGSPDTAALEEILRPFRSQIIYLQQQHRGPSAARNLGIRRARAPYVALLDSDDTWLPEHLALQMAHFSANPELGLVYANNLQVRDGRVLGEAFVTVPQSGIVNLDSLLAEDCTVNTSSVVASRESMISAGLFNESMDRCEDFDLWLRMAAAGTRMACDPRVQVRHRLGCGLSSHAELMKRGRLQAYENISLIHLSPTQRTIVDRKRLELTSGIQIEIAKQRLEQGRFAEARAAINQARTLAPSRKLEWAALGMRISPFLLRGLYHGYRHGLQAWRRVRTPAHADASSYSQAESLPR